MTSILNRALKYFVKFSLPILSNPSRYIYLFLYVLLQPPQSLLRRLQHVVLLAHGEPDVILGDVRVGVGVELGRGDGRDADLLDHEPGELEVARPAGHVRRERVVRRQLDFRHVHHDEVPALRVRVGQPELVPDFVESSHLALHVPHCLVPEAF